MLDASRTNETAAAEKISKLQEEKKVLQVRHRFLAERISYYMAHIIWVIQYGAFKCIASLTHILRNE